MGTCVSIKVVKAIRSDAKIVNAATWVEGCIYVHEGDGWRVMGSGTGDRSVVVARSMFMALKRAMDFIAAVIMLLFLCPLLGVLGVLVRVKLGSPVIFAQERPGMRGKVFRLFKFRTMTDARDPDGCPLPDEQRLTRFGRTLRATSLDELPELWNVLRGDMSLVGPRPLLVSYLERYTPEQARRHEVRPGITGLAQVSGRNELGWDARFELDVWYVDNQSFGLDVKILFLTFLRVVRREGVTSPGHATMPEFLGDE